MKTAELYSTITNQVIEQLKAGTPPWTKPWKDSHVRGIGMVPSNLVSGRLYSGSNILLLWMTAHMRGYEALQFCTYNQVNSINASVRKGEKATHIIFTKHVLRKDEAGEDKPSTIVKSYPVFNVAQLDRVPDKYLYTQQPLELETPERKFKDMIQLAGVDVRFGFNRACYIPSQDCIQMPAFGAFKDEEGFASTLLHEVGHWTGNEKRLDRKFGKRFADPAYSFEELVAELTSAFLCARLGYQPQTQTASYLESWLKVLKADNRAIFSASSYAGHAADYVWNLAYGEEESAPDEERQLEAAE